MAISESPILDPEASKPGVPLKKSTLAVILVILLALGFVSSLVLSGGSQNGPKVSPVVKDTSALKRVGTDQVLRDEEAEAARKAKQERAQAAANAAASAALPPARPPVPPSVRREDNTSALFDKQGRASRAKDLELEAQTRMAKALVTDFDPPRKDGTGSGADPTLQPAVEALGAGGAQSSPKAPSSGVADQIDAFRKQLQAAAGGQSSAGRSKEGWLREYADNARANYSVNRGYQAPSRLVLRQGKVIPAVLGRQINSDLPGSVTAYVSSNVYDAEGRLLIPMGASLIGKYDSGVQVGQSRVLFAFDRLVLPNGYSFNLSAAPGSDLAGAAGMAGDVDNHFLKMFGTSLLIAVLADHTKQPENVTQLGGGGPVLTAAGQVLSDVSKTILQRNRVIPPTITVDQGTRINVEVAQDMVFPEQYPVR